MLWYKGWLETRFRLLFALGFMCVFVVLLHSAGAKAPPPGAKPVVGVALLAMVFAATASGMLSGAGINTQPSFQATKGIHGSMFFTLSLPVSRFRLLAIRAGLGWLETAGVIGALCCALWLALPVLRGAVTSIEMFEYAGTLMACASALYFISVVLATFLDDLWRMFGSMIAFWGLWALSSYARLPVSVNIFRAMGEGSPLIAHTMPWTAMAFSLGIAAILFFAAIRIVQIREY
jgi:hypothetical protein